MKEKNKILIIEDDLDMVEAMKVTLESGGYSVVSAPGGREGLEKARREKPCLIILDVMMDSLTDGFHVAYRIRKEGGLKYTPILMVTAITQETGTPFSPDTDGKFLPVDDFAEKPVEPAELLNRVENLLKLDKDRINVSGRKGKK